MAKVSKMSSINPRCIILPVAFSCLCATDIRRTCACWVKIPVFEAMVKVAIAYGRHMWDPIVCVCTAVESPRVRVRGLIRIVDEASKGWIAGARLTHRIDSEIFEYGRELCGRKCSKRATQAEYNY